MSLYNFCSFTLFKLQQEPAIWECQDPAFGPVADVFNFDKGWLAGSSKGDCTSVCASLQMRGSLRKAKVLTSCIRIYLMKVTNIGKGINVPFLKSASCICCP